MAEMLFKTKGNASPSGKPRVYFTCHKDDFDLYFERVCEYIFKSHDCAVYYTADMNEIFDESDKVTDLESNNLFVVPVTFKLLSTPNRAMDEDIKFALERHIPVLPLMMETGLDAIYSRPDKFGELQYLMPFTNDATEVSFDEKLKKYLESVLVSDEMAKRVRAAFDAYIFLSYRKKDRKYANQLMRIIHNKPECRDIAIWYDEFLTPGESFRENIDKILADSKLFTLLVTPNLLEDHNFVMEQEYPAAVKSGIGILPAEMEETDKNILAEKYANLPEISNPYDDEQFRKRLADTLSNLAIKSNDTDPEHNFLIGLAYLDGIDVEVDRERALDLITKAAEAQLPEAMEKLYYMYHNGTGVNLDYTKATEWAEKLLAHHIDKYGAVHSLSLRCMNMLVSCYSDIGNYKKALQTCENAFDASVRLYSEKHDSVITVLNNLVFCHLKLGNYAKAAQLNAKAYQLSREFNGENHINTITSLHNLASYYAQTGDYAKAAMTEEKVYSAVLNVHGDENALTVSSLNNLALYYSKTYDFEKAFRCAEKVHLLSCKIHGDDHPLTATSLVNLASSYACLKNYDKALQLSEKAYEMRNNILGSEHPDTVNVLSNISVYNDNAGNHSQAVAMAEKAYLLRQKILGDKHPDTLISLNNFALFAQHNKDYKKSVELGEKAYALSTEIVGEIHPYTAAILNNLSSAYYELNNSCKVLEMDIKAYSIRRQVFGENHPETIVSANNIVHSSYIIRNYNSKTREILYNVAENHKNIGQNKKAVQLCKRILSSEYKVNGKNSTDAIKVLICLGQAHYAEGHRWRAKRYLKKAYTLCINLPGAEYEDTVTIKKLLDEIK